MSNLPLWGIISVITQIDDFDPCDEKEIRRITDILDGRENHQYAFQIKLPNPSEKDQSAVILNSLYKLQRKETLTESEFKNLEEFSGKKFDEISTIDQKLEMYISSMISASFDLYPDDSEVAFAHKSTVYLPEEDENKELYLLKIIRYLKCYIGEEPLTVCTEYRNGIPSVSFLI